VTDRVGDNRQVSERHPMLTYTLMRVLLFAVPFVALLAFGVPLLWAMLIAAFFSGTASIVVLSRQRDAVSTAISSRAARTKQRMADRTASEDAWDDAQREQGAGEREPDLAEGEPESQQ